MMRKRHLLIVIQQNGIIVIESFDLEQRGGLARKATILLLGLDLRLFALDGRHQLLVVIFVVE